MACPVEYRDEEKVWRNFSNKQDFPFDKFVGELLLDRFNELDSNKVIEVHHDNGFMLTVGDLKKLSITCAKNYLRLGLKQGDIVMYFSTMNSYITPTVFGLYLIGAALHPIDVNCTEDDLEYSCSIITPTIILCDGNVYDRVQEAIQRENLTCVKHVLSFHPREDGNTVEEFLMKPVESVDDFQHPKLGDPSKVILAMMSSSGSTGRPKVSMLSHSTIVFGLQTWWTTDESSIIYCPSLLRWISQVSIMIQAVLYGFCRVLSTKPPSGELCANVISKHKVTHFFGLPTLILDILEVAEKQNISMDSLRILLTGGERIPTLISRRVEKIIPKCKLLKCYGMSEVAGVICSNEHVKNYDGSGGYLMPGFSAKIVDENFKNLGPNEKGQICLKPLFTFSGYWKGARNTAEAFDKDGWFITGDFGYFDENKLLFVTDRYKEIIPYNGQLIFPSSIEQLLYNHPYVSVAIVIGVPHKDGQIPVAFIKVTDEVKTSMTENKIRKAIIEYLESQLSKDEIPAGGIFFVEEFPLTYTGKVYRQRMKMIAVDLMQQNGESVNGTKVT